MATYGVKYEQSMYMNDTMPQIKANLTCTSGTPMIAVILTKN